LAAASVPWVLGC